MEDDSGESRRDAKRRKGAGDEKKKGKGKRSYEQFRAEDEKYFVALPRHEVEDLTGHQAAALLKLFLSYLSEAPQGPLPSTLCATVKRRGKVSLIPKSKPKEKVADIIMTPRKQLYVGLLDNIASDTAQGTVWHTLTFDCFRWKFLKKVKGQLLDPDFPFDQMAVEAGNCLIEFSLAHDHYTALNQRLIGEQGDAAVQDLTPRTWWLIATQDIHSPDAVAAIMMLPEKGSADPTTIVTDENEVVTFVVRLKVPPVEALQILVAMSHEDLPYGLPKK